MTTKDEFEQRLEKWLKALRSKEYEQGKDVLCRLTYGNTYEYCCLGVACEITGMYEFKILKGNSVTVSYDGQKSYLPEKTIEYYGFKNKDPSIKKADGSIVSLADMNDNGWTFENIADVIEKHKTDLFTWA